MDLTEILATAWVILMWPFTLVAYVLLAAIGGIVVGAFFLGIWRFIMWGMSGRRW